MSDILTNRKKQLLVMVLIVITVLLMIRFSGSSDSDAAAVIEPRVPVVSVIDLTNTSSASNASLSLTGEVESQQRADLSSQISETVSSISVNIGQVVYPGQRLITLNNSTLVAGRDQLQAALDAENALLSELEKGTRTEQLAVYETQFLSAEVAYTNAQTSLFDRVRDGYTRADDAIHNNLDIFFNNPRDPFTELIFLPYDLQIKIDLERDRPQIEQMLSEWKSIVDSMTVQSDLEVYAAEAHKNLLFLRDFVDTLANGVNAMTPSNNFSEGTLSGWRATVSGVRSGINGAISALIASGDGFRQSAASLAVAQSQLDLARAGASDDQIAMQKARVSAAEAALSSAQANLGKTIITSPIRGVVSEVPVDSGDLVNPGQLLVSVVNKDALSVTAFISTDNLRYISLDSPVVIEDDALGHVAQISPSVNSQTKKVEISVTIDRLGTQPLVDGQFVNLKVSTINKPLVIPLSAIQTEGDSAFVYSVDENSVVTAHEVVLGPILGESVEITEGLEGVQSIISSVRGIKVGSTVTIQ